MQVEGFHTTDDGVDLWYGLTGPENGPVLILNDGIGCNGFAWPHLMDHFAHSMRILRWHYRGHGRSTTPEDITNLTLERLTTDLFHLHDELGLAPGVIGGHSMGVQLSLEYYRQHPDRCRALVLVCGSYGRPLATFKNTNLGESVLPILRAVADMSPRLTRSLWSRLVPTSLTFRLAQLAEINPRRAKRADIFPYLEHISHVDPRLFLGMLTHVSEHDAKDVLPGISVPTLIVAGDMDGFTPGDLAEEMSDLIPGAELLVLPEGTHATPVEYPREVNEAVDEFLCRHEILG